MGSSRFHIPAMAAMAGIALAASGLAMSTSTDSKKKRHKRSKKYVTGLVSKNSNVNSILQALATSDALRSYLAERVDERGDELDRLEISHNAYILQSLAYALYTTIELLNKPHSRPETAMPTDFLQALERHTKIYEDQDIHSLFKTILNALAAEEHIQYRDEPSSLMDAHPSRSRMIAAIPDQDAFETASISSIATTCTSFSVCSPAGYLKPRQRRPKCPFQGLQATQWTCIRCNYSAPVDHTHFNSLTLENTSDQTITIEACLEAFTRIETRMEYACRKCMLLATLDSLTQQSVKDEQQDEETLAEHFGKIQVLKDAIRYNVEASLPGIPLVRPIASTTPASKQTQLANVPQILCIRLSGGGGKIHFSEHLDLAPYTTQDQQTPRARLSRPSRIFLRNMAAGYRFVHHASGGGNGMNSGVGDGLGVALLGKEDNKEPVSQQQQQQLIENPLPSLVSSFRNGIGAAAALRTLPYKLTAVIVESQGITFRRMRLPTGHKVRRPDDSSVFGKKQQQQQQQQEQRHHVHQPKANTVLFWRCQDDRVDQVTLDEVLKSDASMLFYERDV
ncbi:hypothetical protein BX666DRAFT_48823 [Dichotomocladium elegans]|nr:hypothetical protein BX666DRAFT_48823 [Dichotomocladium elegans]